MLIIQEAMEAHFFAQESSSNNKFLVWWYGNEMKICADELEIFNFCAKIEPQWLLKMKASAT